MSHEFKTLQHQINNQGIAILLMDILGRNANVKDDHFRDELSIVIDMISSNDDIKGAVISAIKNDVTAASLRIHLKPSRACQK